MSFLSANHLRINHRLNGKSKAIPLQVNRRSPPTKEGSAPSEICYGKS